MDRERWPPLSPLLQPVARTFSRKYAQHRPWALVAVMLWAALHDRPVSWACPPRPGSTPRRRPARRPAADTVRRRLGGVAVGLFWGALADRVRGAGPPALGAIVDGKPLLVGGCSEGPGAAFGRAAGHAGRGDPRPAVGSTRPLPEAREVTPLSG